MQMTIVILRCNCLEYGSGAKQRRITPLLHRKCRSVARCYWTMSDKHCSLESWSSFRPRRQQNHWEVSELFGHNFLVLRRRVAVTLGLRDWMLLGGQRKWKSDAKAATNSWHNLSGYKEQGEVKKIARTCTKTSFVAVSAIFFTAPLKNTLVWGDKRCLQHSHTDDCHRALVQRFEKRHEGKMAIICGWLCLEAMFIASHQRVLCSQKD